MKVFIFVCAVIMLLFGCTREVMETRDVDVRIHADIASQLTESEIQVDRYSNGALRTVAFSALGSGTRQMVHWSVHWFDSAGKKVGGTSDRWRRATIDDGSPFRLQVIAPSERIHQADIFIRPYP